MSTQCYEEKFGQNIYRRMLSSRFKFLFGLPTRRLKGKSLVWNQSQLYWRLRWRLGRIKETLGEIGANPVDGIQRNYGKNAKFFAGTEGESRLRRAVDILSQQGLLRDNLDGMIESIRRNTQAAVILVTLGYAFEK